MNRYQKMYEMLKINQMLIVTAVWDNLCFVNVREDNSLQVVQLSYSSFSAVFLMKFSKIKRCLIMFLHLVAKENRFNS